ncbi:ATPase, T2SS/T4P/T4SS family [Klenkia terrae]
MRPSRLVVGEVRQEECLDLLIALNSGLPGMCTLHANSAREAVVKMCTLPLLAGRTSGTPSSSPPWPAAWTWWCTWAPTRPGTGGCARWSPSPAAPRAP